jgi:hypothetical protein
VRYHPQSGIMSKASYWKAIILMIQADIPSSTSLIEAVVDEPESIDMVTSTCLGVRIQKPNEGNL